MDQLCYTDLTLLAEDRVQEPHLVSTSWQTAARSHRWTQRPPLWSAGPGPPNCWCSSPVEWPQRVKHSQNRVGQDTIAHVILQRYIYIYILLVPAPTVLTVQCRGPPTPPIRWGRSPHTSRTPVRAEHSHALWLWRQHEQRRRTSSEMHQSSLCSSAFHRHTCLSWPHVRNMLCCGCVARPHNSSTWPCKTHTRCNERLVYVSIIHKQKLIYVSFYVLWIIYFISFNFVFISFYLFNSDVEQ